MRHRLLIITNLFGYPWAPHRAQFNQQQFERLAQRYDVTVLVPVSISTVLRNLRRYLRANREARPLWPFVRYTTYWHIPGTGYWLNWLFYFLSLVIQNPRLLFGRRWDCLLASWGYPDAVAVALLGRLIGTPVVAKVHGSDVNVVGQMPTIRRQFRRGLGLASAVVAVSAALRDKLIDMSLPAVKLHLVYNGVDSDRFQPRPRASCLRSLGWSDSAKVLLFVGNLLPAKGCLDLIEAFAKVAEEDSELELAFVGSGPALLQLRERAARPSLSGRVRLAGTIAHAELPVWYSAARLLCLPSYSEGVPNVILEAMACGTPVIATRVGGIPEVVDETCGILTAAGDVPALAEEISACLRKDWDADALRSTALRFNWDRNIVLMSEVIDNAVRPDQR